MRPTKIIRTRASGEAVVLKDTTRIQMLSLTQFARALNFIWFEDKWVSVKEEYKLDRSRSFVSMQTMVKWHNLHFYPTGLHWSTNTLDNQSDRLGFTHHSALSMMEMAIKSKLLMQVKIQFNKKDKRIVIQDHQISFV